MASARAPARPFVVRREPRRVVSGDLTRGEDHSELVTAEAQGDVTLPHVLLHEQGHALQHLVAGGVPMQVVDDLEVVEVDQHQGADPLVGHRSRSQSSKVRRLDRPVSGSWRTVRESTARSALSCSS